ncbi:MAG: acetylxylan esterase [Bacillota bacterium]
MSAGSYVTIAAAALLLGGGICIRILKVPRGRRLRGLFIALSFILAAVFAAKVVLFPELNSIETTGEYAFASESFQLNDTARPETYADDGSCRKLSVVAYYPDSEAITENSCPLVVFSHGGISQKNSNVSLYKELASHGYVVVSIDHTYQSLYTTIDGRRVSIDSGYMKQLQTEDPDEDIANSYACYQEWMAVRTADISFVIDSLIAGAVQADNGFYSLIDPDRIGVMGHSLGGGAALGVARQRDDIKAVAALEAPYFCDITGYDDSGFTWDTSPYGCAMLNIYSDNGWPLVASDIRYAQNKRYLVNEGNVRYLYIEGSNHYTLTDLVRSSPILCAVLGGGYSASGKDTLKAVNAACLEFFDANL